MTTYAPAPTAVPPTRPPQVRSGSLRGLLVLAGLLVVVCLLSLAIGSRAIPLSTVVDVLFHPDGSDASTIVHDLRLPRTVLGHRGRHRARRRRRAHAGPHPQPARRPRPARRRGRRGVRGRDRHLRLRRHRPDRLRLVLPRRRRPRRSGGLRDRLDPRRARPGLPGPRRDGGQRAALLADPGRRAARHRHPRRLPVLGGRLGRQPRHGGLLAGAAVHRRRPGPGRA